MLGPCAYWLNKNLRPAPSACLIAKDLNRGSNSGSMRLHMTWLDDLASLHTGGALSEGEEPLILQSESQHG